MKKRLIFCFTVMFSALLICSCNGNNGRKVTFEHGYIMAEPYNFFNSVVYTAAYDSTMLISDIKKNHSRYDVTLYFPETGEYRNMSLKKGQKIELGIYPVSMENANLYGVKNTIESFSEDEDFRFAVRIKKIDLEQITFEITDEIDKCIQNYYGSMK